jgi:carboxyl-terminal processing protease
MPRRSMLWILAILLVAGLSISQAQPREKYYKEFTRFSQIFHIVMDRYVTPVDAKKLFDGAYRGMLGELDPYSQFMDAEESKSFNEDTQGKFGGLGIEIGIRDGILTVITPIAGSPAYEAGVLPGDRILYIDGKSTERITAQEAVKTLRGKPGTKVTITVRHPGSNLDTNFTLTRAEIKPAVVDSRIVKDEPKIGYIRVHSFTHDMVAEFDKAAEKLNNDGIQALVLDLRGNPGGLLDAAVALSDRFLDKGTIVTVRGREKDSERVFTAKPDMTFGRMPVVVVVDIGTASASEITASALQGNDRALVVGMPTFGKGAVQNVIDLQDGATLKLTTAMYYTPTGKPISREHPVEPDVVITMTAEQILALRDQEAESKMRGKAMDAPKPEGDVAPAPTTEEKQPEKPAGENGEGKLEAKERRKVVKDIQLEGAISILATELKFSKAGGKVAAAK